MRVVIHPPPAPLPLAMTVPELARRWGVPAADIERAIRADRGLAGGTFLFANELRVGEKIMGPLRAALLRQYPRSPR